MKTLPKVKYKDNVYTIDDKLQEYRYYDYGFIVIHHAFNSEEGIKISDYLNQDRKKLIFY